MWVMWLCSIVAEPLLSTRTPYSRLSHPKPPGPWIVNCWMSAFFAWTWTIALGDVITAGAWISAARGFFD